MCVSVTDSERDERTRGCCLQSEASKTGYSVLEIHLLYGALCLIILPERNALYCKAGAHITHDSFAPPDSCPQVYD